jgi:RNA polymerase sigma factor (sigma-70 family)
VVVRKPKGDNREDQLILAVAKGDAAALRELYRAFERPLYALGVRWYGDRDLAEELVQEVTLRIWRKADGYDPAKGAASAWIFGVARNVATDLARSRRRRPTPVENALPPPAEPWNEESAWLAWEVGKAIRRLPLEQQKVIELAYVYQFTHSEIAKTLDIPLGTVKTRIQLGLGKLETYLVRSGIVGEPVS